jgi:pyridoxamine 5'-phosphate oxidase
MSARFDGLEVSRPENWGGYEVTPDTIEFLKFSPSRLHERTLFRRAGRHWTRALLQP